MKALALSMALAMLGLALVTGEAAAAGSDRDPPPARQAVTPSAEQEYGRVDDARKILERLKPLDAGRAGELAEAIAKGQ